MAELLKCGDPRDFPAKRIIQPLFIGIGFRFLFAVLRSVLKV